jgi:ZIP family zinc transporter
MLSAGILAFLFMDVGAEGLGIIETHLEAFKAHDASLWPVIGLFALLSAGFLIGVGGIATVQRWLGAYASEPPPLAGAESTMAMSPAELAEHNRAFEVLDRKALRTAMVIAVAIGLHNFAEGLAIGVSAQAGELHNSTEGFGIVGPLSGLRPSWRWLGLAGLVAGGPTFVGAMVGYQVTSDSLELAFFALAGGAILYVIGEIWTGVRRQGHAELGLYMLGVGFLLGIATDLVVAYGGA